jgi:hypothetical protein
MKNIEFTTQELEKFKEAFEEQKCTGYDEDLVNKGLSESFIPPSLSLSLLNESCQKDYLLNILPELKANFFDNSPELIEKYLQWLGGYYEKLLQSPYYDPNASVQEFAVESELTGEELEWLNSVFLSGQNSEESTEQ